MKTVAFLIFSDVMMLDFSGPAEVFAVANRYLPEQEQYLIQTIGAEDGHQMVSLSSHNSRWSKPLICCFSQGRRRRVCASSVGALGEKCYRQGRAACLYLYWRLLLAEAGLLCSIDGAWARGLSATSSG